MSMIKMLFLGQNPSKAAPNSAFVGTRSHDTLMSWILASGAKGEVSFENVFDDPLQEHFSSTLIASAASSSSFAEKIEGYDVIFTCGNVAAQAVALYVKNNPDFSFDTTVVNIPHPSGLNRILNNKSMVDEVVAKIRKACEDKTLEKMERPEEGSGVRVDDFDGGRLLQGKNGSTCPVVDIYNGRKKND